MFYCCTSFNEVLNAIYFLYYNNLGGKYGLKTEEGTNEYDHTFKMQRDKAPMDINYVSFASYDDEVNTFYFHCE